MKLKKIILYTILVLLIPVIAYGITISVDELRQLQGGEDMTFGATILPVKQGGTGASTFTSGECLVGAGTGAITTSACGSGGGSAAWEKYTGLSSPANIITPTTTNASIYVSGSATTTGTLQVVTSLATGTAQPNSTTTANFGGNVYVQGSATTTNNFSAGGTLYVQQDTGRVGIGTVTPTAKLTVNGTMNFTNTGNNVKIIDFSNGGGTGYSHYWIYGDASNYWNQYSGTGYLVTGNIGIGAANGQIQSLSGYDLTLSGGNNDVILGTSVLTKVGIGLTNPTSTLSVLGSADIRGDATTTGNLIVGASSWDAPTSTLTVNGSGYFTGNLITSGNATTTGHFSAGEYLVGTAPINLDNIADGASYERVAAAELTSGIYKDASVSVKGIASFSDSYFTVTSGSVTIDDIYLRNDASDTTSGGLTMNSATTTDSLRVGGNATIIGFASSTTGLFSQGNGHIGGAFTVDGVATSSATTTIGTKMKVYTTDNATVTIEFLN